MELFCFITVRPIEMTNCIFHNNTGNQGGALYIRVYFKQNDVADYEKYMPSCTISHCSFTDNVDLANPTDTFSPSVIFLDNMDDDNAGTDINILDCTFEGNIKNQPNKGYCIFAAGKSITIARNIFNNSDADNSCGGAHIIQRSSISIDGNQFIKCNPRGIYFSPIHGTDPESITIKDCNFDSNKGTEDGISFRLLNVKSSITL